MAYKEETDQQFMESIIRQTAGAMRRPMGDQQFHGSRGYGADDDSFGLDNSDDDFQRAEPEQVDAMRGRMSSFTKPYPNSPQVGAELNEPMPQFGGYSGDTGTRHMPPKHLEHPSYLDDRMNLHKEMKSIKKEIEAKEKELHELQRSKVELMRKITGRL